MAVTGTVTSSRDSQADDRKLMTQIAAGDKRSFETLYRRYYRRMYHFVLKLVRRDDIAEETVDDVMFAVWKTASAFEGRSSVSTWLFGIAYRQALKSIERDRRHRALVSDDQRVAMEADLHPAADPEAGQPDMFAVV